MNTTSQTSAAAVEFDYFNFIELVELLFPINKHDNGYCELASPDRQLLLNWGKSVSSWLLTDSHLRQPTALLEQQHYARLLQIIARRYSATEAPEAAHGLFDYGKEYERRVLIRESLKTLFLYVEDFYKTHQPQLPASSTIEVASESPKVTQQGLPTTPNNCAETDVKVTSHNQIDVIEEDAWDIEFFD